MTAPISYPLTHDGLRSALAAVDDRPAESLSAWGFKGSPMKEDRCVLANYLRAACGADKVEVFEGKASVFGSAVEAWDGMTWTQPVVLTAELPALLIDFISDFDSARYPNLIEEDSDAPA